MTLTFEEHVFLIVVILNTIIAVLYLLIGSLIMVPIRNRKEKGRRSGCMTTGEPICCGLS